MNAMNDELGTPLSLRIRERLKKENRRFLSNDNIADVLKEGELDLLQVEVERVCENLLQALLIDVESDPNCKNTAKRMAAMYLHEVFAGRYTEQPVITEFPNTGRLNELMIVGPISVRGTCSHHFCPIMGEIWLGILPNKETNVVGLSKYSRLVNWVMSRPQIQEEAILQLADLLEGKTQPDGLAIVMRAKHFCMSWRGVKEPHGMMMNSVMRGAFLKNNQLRSEFLSLLPKVEGHSFK